jgi:CRP/FNR family nitrogen fixation transcriptional regulator
MGVTVLDHQARQSSSLSLATANSRWSALRGSGSHRISIRRGEMPASVGISAHQCFFVIEGALRIWRSLSDGRRQITAFAFAGDWVGFDDVGEDNVCIEAVTPVLAERYLLRNLQTAAAADAEVAASLQDLLRSRIRATQERILVLGHKNTREKIASFILEMSDRLADGEDMVELPMSRHDIADYLGMSPETVCRNLTNLVADGMIMLPTPNLVRILRRSSLEYIAI